MGRPRPSTGLGPQGYGMRGEYRDKVRDGYSGVSAEYRIQVLEELQLVLGVKGRRCSGGKFKCESRTSS